MLNYLYHKYSSIHYTNKYYFANSRTANIYLCNKALVYSILRHFAKQSKKYFVLNVCGSVKSAYICYTNNNKNEQNAYSNINHGSKQQSNSKNQ